MTPRSVMVNRAPVLTLWAAIVAERLGHERATALTLGKAVAGLNAQSKGRRLGIYEAPTPEEEAAAARRRERAGATSVPLLGRHVPVVETRDGVRAVHDGTPERPEAVARYLEQKFGDALPEVEAAMRALAHALPPRRLERVAYDLYERFRPVIPEGTRGWGAKGRLDLDLLAELARIGDIPHGG